MSGLRVVLQSRHDGPAIHPGKTDIQDDGAWIIIISEMQACLSVFGNQYLESLFAGQVEQGLCERVIILDDQNGSVIRGYLFSIIGDEFAGFRLTALLNIVLRAWDIEHRALFILYPMFSALCFLRFHFLVQYFRKVEGKGRTFS